MVVFSGASSSNIQYKVGAITEYAKEGAEQRKGGTTKWEEVGKWGCISNSLLRILPVLCSSISIVGGNL